MSKSSRFSVILSATLVLALAPLASPAFAQQAAKEQVVRFGLAFNDIATLDPHVSVGSSETPILGHIYEGLVEFPHGHMDGSALRPGLAQRWSSSADSKSWTFELRRGVKWHKGFGDFTAEDVKYSIDRVAGKEFSSPFRRSMDNVDRVEIVDPYKVRVQLKQPDPTFPQLVAGYQSGYVMSKAAADKKVDPKLDPVGTGPFVMSGYKPRESVTLARNDTYWGGKPIVERIVFQFMPEASTRELAMRSGEVHAIGIHAKQETVDRMRAGGFKVDLTAPANMFVLYLNVSKKPLDDIRVRKALAHATDRANLIAFLGKDLASPEYSALPAAYTGHASDIEKYPLDLARAKALLAEAGLRDGFTMTVNISNSNIYLPPMQVIQEQWKKIGVNLDLKVVDHPTYHRLIREDANPVVLYGAFRFPMTGKLYFEQFYAGAASIGTPTAITNFTHYGGKIPGVDEFLSKAAYNSDGNEQVRLWQAAQKQIAKDAISIPLYTQFYAMSRSPRLDLGHEQKSFSFYQLSEKSRLLAP